MNVNHRHVLSASTHTILDQCAFEFANICGMVQGTGDDADWVHKKSSLVGQEDHTLLLRCKGKIKNKYVPEKKLGPPKVSCSCLSEGDICVLKTASDRC